MSPHKGPQVIRYCVITSTAALVAIAVGLIPQYKVNKGKILCADYAAKDAQLMKMPSEIIKYAVKQKVEAGLKVSSFAKTTFVEEYCRSL
mgnify:CR=1 FL=1